MVENINNPYNPAGLPAELQKHMRKTVAALKESIARRALMNPNSISHPDKLKAMGELWRIVRETRGLSIHEAANAVDVPWQDLDLFEGGLIDPQDYRDRFIDSLGETLGVPDIAQFHKNLFNPKR